MMKKDAKADACARLLQEVKAAYGDWTKVKTRKRNNEGVPDGVRVRKRKPRNDNFGKWNAIGTNKRSHPYSKNEKIKPSGWNTLPGAQTGSWSSIPRSSSKPVPVSTD